MKKIVNELTMALSYFLALPVEEETETKIKKKHPILCPKGKEERNRRKIKKKKESKRREGQIKHASFVQMEKIVNK